MSTSKEDFDLKKTVEELESSVKKLHEIQKKRNEIDKQEPKIRRRISDLQKELYNYLGFIEVESPLERLLSLDKGDRYSVIDARPYRGLNVKKGEVVKAYQNDLPRDLFLGSTNMKSVDRWLEKLENGERP